MTIELSTYLHDDFAIGLIDEVKKHGEDIEITLEDDLAVSGWSKLPRTLRTGIEIYSARIIVALKAEQATRACLDKTFKV